MSPSEYICSEVNFPICRALGLESSKYRSGYVSLLELKIQAPYNFITFLIIILCSVRIINHVNSLYASIGRGEMRTLFSLYIVSNFIMSIISTFESVINTKIFSFLSILQISISSTLFFGIFVSGLTIDRIYGIFGMKSSTFMRTLSTIYFIVISSFVSLCVSVKNHFIILLILAINALSIFFYISKQINKLRKTKSDIWAFGVLGIIFSFFALSLAHTLTASSLVAYLSERNLDNLFFVTIYTFFMMMMIHKYWLSTCDFELECLSLNV